MGSKLVSAPGFFTLNLAARAMVIALLVMGILFLLVATHYYATALVLAGLMLVAIVDMARLLMQLDASTMRIFEALGARAHEIPLGGAEQFVPGLGAVGKTVALLQDERRAHARQIAYLQSMIDTVASALMVVGADGRIQLANRAAKLLAGEMVGRLGDVCGIGPEVAGKLLALQPGSRDIMRLANGQQMLASMTEFSAPGTANLRLLSLQSIVGELDAVELKAWRDMTRVLAHEMMNSLTPISSLAESLPELLETKSDEALVAVETISRRTQGLLHFVERYRKVADLPEPVLRPLGMGEFVESLDRLMAPLLARKHVAYASVVTPLSLTVLADAELLSQAVINLLKNAMDAVEGQTAGAIRLTCSQHEGQVLIAVADTGPGISPEGMDDIFVPFFTTKKGGAGIGLTLARRIALAHGGHIAVNKNPEGGATFVLALPAVATT